MQARQGMRACNNNNMRNPSLHLFYYGVTHVIIVACPHPLSCCTYTALVSLLFGTVIPTSFNILMEMFLLPYLQGFHQEIWGVGVMSDNTCAR